MSEEVAGRTQPTPVDQGQAADGVAPSGESGFSPHRLEAFSDGVMAVIITIMAFEIKAPAGPHWANLQRELPSLLVYILSFAYIGIYWNNHHHLLRLTPRINGAVMWANLAVLFWLSLVPVLTEWVANWYRNSLPAAAYGTADLGAAIAYWVLVRTIIRANADSHVATAIGSDVKGIASAAMYALGIGLAAVDPWLSYAVYVAVALMWFVPDRRLVGGPGAAAAKPIRRLLSIGRGRRPAPR